MLRRTIRKRERDRDGRRKSERERCKTGKKRDGGLLRREGGSNGKRRKENRERGRAKAKGKVACSRNRDAM